MIENHAQFQITQEQIQRLEQALEQLRQTASTAEFMARHQPLSNIFVACVPKLMCTWVCRTLTLMHAG